MSFLLAVIVATAYGQAYGQKECDYYTDKQLICEHYDCVWNDNTMTCDENECRYFDGEYDMDHCLDAGCSWDWDRFESYRLNPCYKDRAGGRSCIFNPGSEWDSEKYCMEPMCIWSEDSGCSENPDFDAEEYYYPEEICADWCMQDGGPFCNMDDCAACDGCDTEQTRSSSLKAVNLALKKALQAALN